ncbi:hypothetical protein NM688_g7637 [Phlebia brevispora]|uniref:Uncharacterized protein n=1 Tax=Phlebia brevispora TaxID=194682 RepID=A0ACC1S2V7_9APHY|nr:hypothetical protein NM688_g7637 [Phlebia brevispora]
MWTSVSGPCTQTSADLPCTAQPTAVALDRFVLAFALAAAMLPLKHAQALNTPRPIPDAECTPGSIPSAIKASDIPHRPYLDKWTTTNTETIS